LTQKSENARGEVEIYLAFPDGVFHYVCAECNALCCRAGDVGGSLRREMGALLTLYPALQNSVDTRCGNYLKVLTPRGRCYFLDDGNLCRIEKEHGRALKPGVCTLFPFNIFRRIGKVVAISPHFMCPLRLHVPARPGEVEGTHSFVEAAARETQMFDAEYVAHRVPQLSLHTSHDARATLKRESLFRDTCMEAIGHRTFIETLRADSSDAAWLDLHVKRAADRLGLPVAGRPRLRDYVDDLLLALAPALRLNYLDLSAEGILLALALGESFVRQALRISSDPLAVQGAYHVLGNLAPALRLLGRADEPLSASRNIDVEAPAFCDPELTFAAFIALSHLRGPVPAIDALEQAITPTLSNADRSALVNELALRLDQAPLASTKKKRRSARV
jgi:hypothetical protein